MSNKNFAAAAVLALAGAFANQAAEAADVKQCTALKADASLEKIQSKSDAKTFYVVKDTLACKFQVVGASTVIPKQAFDLSNTADAAAFETASADFATTGTAVAAATTAEKPKDPCDNIVEKNRTVSTVAGAALGGILGKKIGKGKNEDAATVGGAVVGGVVGNQVAKCDKPQP